MSAHTLMIQREIANLHHMLKLHENTIANLNARITLADAEIAQKDELLERQRDTLLELQNMIKELQRR
jgi:septal ring factor EnvC (AmiA/AmiB activator)